MSGRENPKTAPLLNGHWHHLLCFSYELDGRRTAAQSVAASNSGSPLPPSVLGRLIV